MFSGIIEELGNVQKFCRKGNGFELAVTSLLVSSDVKIGDSVSVNGVCLTVVENKNKTLVFDCLAETAQKTNLGTIRSNEKVNLERSLKVGDRISGHFVSGHVDCIGIIKRKFIHKANLCFEMSVPTAYRQWCVSKGSIAIDGISLTIAEILSNTIRVYVIPHTLDATTLSFKNSSDKVNLEFDMVIKAVVGK